MADLILRKDLESRILKTKEEKINQLVDWIIEDSNRHFKDSVTLDRCIRIPIQIPEIFKKELSDKIKSEVVFSLMSTLGDKTERSKEDRKMVKEISDLVEYKFTSAGYIVDSCFGDFSSYKGRSHFNFNIILDLDDKK